MSILVKALNEFGLNEKAIAVYLTLFKTGFVPVSTISRVCNLKRSTTYTIIDELLEKGLVNEVVKNNLHYYYVNDPNIVITKIKQKQDGLTNLIKQIEIEIASGKNSNHNFFKPKAKYFSKPEGIKFIFEEALMSEFPLIRGYFSTNLEQFLKENFPKYDVKRQERNKYEKIINPLNLKTKNYQYHDYQQKRERRFISERFDIGIDLMFYDNKVALISIVEEFGIVIESQLISIALTKFFDYIWKFTFR